MWITGSDFTGDDLQEALATLPERQKILYLGGGNHTVVSPIDLGKAQLVGMVEGAKHNRHPLWIGPYSGKYRPGPIE